MPIVNVLGLPSRTDVPLLQALKTAIAAEVSTALECELSWVHVFFQTDLLPENDSHVFAFITTATLAEKVNGEALASAAALRVTKAIHDILGGKKFVETFVCPVPNMRWRASLRPLPEVPERPATFHP